MFDTRTYPFPNISDQVLHGGQVSVTPASHLRVEKEYLTVLSLLSYIIENKIDDFGVGPALHLLRILHGLDEVGEAVYYLTILFSILKSRR